MKSPVARSVELDEVVLEEGLVAHQCPKSKGLYISLQNYWAWLKQQPQRLEQLPQSSEGSCELVDSSGAKICPESGTIMLRYKVGHGFSFTIDRSMTGGVWFDAGEWEALKDRQFHDEIHLIFTAPWQSAIQKEQTQKVQEEILQERFDAQLLADIKALKAELDEHEHREFALAYLGAQ